MSGLDEKHVNCPSEEELLAYKKRELMGDEHEAVSLHLLFCDTCLGYLTLLSSSTQLNEEPDQEKEQSDFQVIITPSLANAVERFLARQSQVKELAEKSWDQIQQEGGLEIGQIWRTRAEGIVLPRKDEKELLSVSQLDSAPHIVVITGTDAGTKTHLNEQYHIIRVAPVTADIDYAGAGDILVPKADSPLGYALMVQLCNEQLMLRENLESWVGEFNQSAHQSILALLEQQGQTGINEGAFSLEAVILKGLYRDPVMRYRAKEYEETRYLRVPVEVLLESIVEAETEAAEVEDVSSASASSTLVREWLKGMREWLHFQFETEGRPLLIEAQQKSKSGWPLEAQMAIEVEGESLAINLEFNWRGSSLIVEACGSWKIGEIVLPLHNLNRSIQLRHNARAIVGPLEEFGLTANSSKEEIIAALVAAGLSQPYVGEIS